MLATSLFARRLLLAAAMALLLLAAPRAADAAGGARDPSFNGSGLVDVWGSLNSGSNYSIARAAVVQPDGKIIVVGQIEDAMTFKSEFAVVRLNPDGSYDGTFGVGGMVNFSISGGGAQRAEAVQLLQDGSIIVAGQTQTGVGVLKLTPSGTPDASFGTGGAVIAPGPTGFDRLTVSLGRAVLLDGAEPGTLVRLTPSGAPDQSFGGTGVVPVKFPTAGYTTGLIAGPGGSVVVGGYDSPNANGYNFALARYNESGALDAGFGSGGLVQINEGYTDAAKQSSVNEISDLAAAPDGSIIAWGHIGWDGVRKSGETESFGPVPHEGTGNILAHFSASGAQLSATLVPTEDRFASRVAAAPDGSVFAIQTGAEHTAAGSASVVRFSPAGAIDGNFGVNGLASANFGTNYYPAGNDTPLDVATQPNGQPIIVGLDDEPKPAPYSGAAMRLLIGAAAGLTSGGGTSNTSGGGTSNTSGGASNAGGVTTSTGGSSPAAGIASVGHVSVSGVTASVPITCRGGTGGSCTVTLALSVRETLKGSKVIAITAAAGGAAKTRKRTVALGTMTVVLAVGSTKTVHIGLNRAGKLLLATRHNLRVKVTVTSPAQPSSALVITLKTPARKTKSKHR